MGQPVSGFATSARGSTRGASYMGERAPVLIVGPCGTGKSRLAQALGHCAVRQGVDVVFTTCATLTASLNAARAIGGYDRKLASLARVPLLIVDDFALKPLRPPADEDLHDLITERYEQVTPSSPLTSTSPSGIRLSPRAGCSRNTSPCLRRTSSQSAESGSSSMTSRNESLTLRCCRRAASGVPLTSGKSTLLRLAPGNLSPWKVSSRFEDGAVPDNRKAAFFDLYKFERYVRSGKFEQGLFVWLTDEEAYLREPKGDSPDFSTHHGRTYRPRTPLHAGRSRNQMPLPLVLAGEYNFAWEGLRVRLGTYLWSRFCH